MANARRRRTGTDHQSVPAPYHPAPPGRAERRVHLHDAVQPEGEGQPRRVVRGADGRRQLRQTRRVSFSEAEPGVRAEADREPHRTGPGHLAAAQLVGPARLAGHPRRAARDPDRGVADLRPADLPARNGRGDSRTQARRRRERQSRGNGRDARAGARRGVRDRRTAPGCRGREGSGGCRCRCRSDRREPAPAGAAALRPRHRRAARGELGRLRTRDRPARWGAQGVEVATEMTMTGPLKDFAVGARSLRRNPAFTLTAIVTLALGIGASTAIFSVTNAVLLRPLPYASPQRLLVITSDLLKRDARDIPVVPGDLKDLRVNTAHVSGIAGVSTTRQALTGDDGKPEQVAVANVTTNLFSLLGVRIIEGRDFADQDGAPAQGEAGPGTGSEASPPSPPSPPSPSIVILSHEFWLRRYGG